MTKIESRSMGIKRDAIINVVFAGIRIVMLLWMLRVASQVFPAALLGAFLLARRIGMTGANLLQLGISQTIRRYLAIHATESRVKQAYVIFAVYFWIILGIVAVAALMFAGTDVASWVFPATSGAEQLFVWTVGLAVTMVLHYIASSVLLAERRMVLFNLHDLIDAGLLLVLPLLYWGSSAIPAEVLRFQTIGMVLLSSAFVGLYVWMMRSGSMESVPSPSALAGTYTGYGLPRGAVSFLDMLLFLLGPWFLRFQPEQAGYLIMALAVVHGLQAALLPLSQVSSIVVGQLVGSGEDTAIRRGTQLMFGTAVFVSVLCVANLWPLKEILLHQWLGQEDIVKGVSIYLAYILIGLVPYTVFQAMKGVIEMRWYHPKNLYTLLFSSIVFLLSVYVLSPRVGDVAGIAIALLVTFWVLGTMTVYWLGADLRPVGYWGFWQLTIVAGSLFAGNIFWVQVVGDWTGFVGIFLTNGFMLYLLLRMFPSPFIVAAEKFFWQGRRIQGEYSS